MTKKKTENTERFVYVKSNELSKFGFAKHEDALAEAKKLGGDTDERRVRVRMRSRNNLWDVVVKLKTAVKSESEHDRV